MNRAAFSDTEQILTLDAGDYALVVDGDGDVTGSFALRLMDLAATTAIGYDQDVSGTLNPSSGGRVYTFNAVAGDRVYFDALANSTGNIRWRLLDPYGNTAFTYRGLSDVDTQVLSFTGAYTLLLEGYIGDNAAATYRFNLRHVVDSVTPLVIGQSSGLDPRWVSGQSGAAVQLDGYDWLQAPATDALNLTGSSTTEFWFKADAYSGTWTPLVFKGNGDSNQRQVTVWLNNAGYLHLSTNTNGAWQGVSTNVGSVQLGQWEHVAAVIDRIGNRLKVYINGTLAVDGGLAGGSALSNSKPLMFGSALESYPRFTGTLDELKAAREEFERIGKQLKTEDLTQEVQVKELREVDDWTYQADLALKIRRKLTESAVKLRVELRIRPNPRRENNPYPYEVERYDEQQAL